MPLQPGEIVHEYYQIIQKLGEGGFGAVYRAWDTRLERDVAIKVNLVDNDEGRRQFEREARYLAKLKPNSNLPQVLDFFILPNHEQYLVMSFVDGDDLETLRARSGGVLPLEKALPWIDEICSALVYLHNLPQPIIHRDIKPANIRIDSDDQAVLVDFGIAKTYDASKTTTVGAKAYTPGYASPEHYGFGKTDAQSDVYSLGATLYSLVTGVVPPESIQILGKNSPPPPPAQRVNPVVPEAVSRVIEKAMQVEKDHRFKTAAEMRTALKEAGARVIFLNQNRSSTTQAVQATPTVRIPTASIPTLSRPTRLWSLVGVVLGIGALIGLLIWNPFGQSASLVSTATSSATSLPLITSTSQDLPVVQPPTRSPLPMPTRILKSTSTLDVSKTNTPMPALPQGTIAFHANRGGNLDIYLIRADGTGLRRMTDYSGKDSFPAWSADGSMLAYQSIRDNNSEIFVMDVESGKSYQVTKNLCSDWAPSFSPDGKELAYYSECDGNREILVHSLEDDSIKQLTYTQNKYNWYPFWSADGQWIYYTTNVSGPYWVHRMDPEGNFQTPLVEGCSGVPSPNGGRLVFQEECLNPTKLFVSNDDGSNTEMIIGGEDVIYGDPYWSPDEKWIVFSSNISGDKNLYILNLETDELIPLTEGGGDDAGPNWTSREW